jgi:hypothetical protein
MQQIAPLAPWQPASPCPQQMPLLQCWSAAQSPSLRQPGWQTPVTQRWAAPQAFPQAPQLAGSLERSAQVPAQQALPAGQSPLLPQVQAPLTQLSPAAQTVPQLPHALFSGVQTPLQQTWPGTQFASLAQPDAQKLAPVAGLVWQCWPATQQVPAQQTWPAPQAVPQLPQWLSVFSGVQTPPQQPWPVVQTVPQAPQLLGSLRMLTQTLLQQPKKLLQQAPPQQRWLARQCRPHEPQWFASLFVSTQPVPRQNVWPVGQVTAHCPPTQLSPLPHAFVQLPQCWASLCRSTQVPPQSVSPLGQT